MAGTSRTPEFMGFFLSLERSNAHEKQMEDWACSRSSAGERAPGVRRPQERLHRCLRSGRRCPPRNCRPHDPARQPTPEVCPFVPPECRTLMLCMDKAGWHVIHDTRYAGAWFDLRVGTPGLPLYKLIFQED